MPLPRERIPEDLSEFVAVRRVFVDSAQRSKGTVSDYVFPLKRAAINVVTFELTGFAIPTSLTPTFRTGVNDVIEFTLTNGMATTTFFTRMPSYSYTYQNVAVPYLDFLRAVEQKLNFCIATDPNFGTGAPAPAVFETAPDPEEHLVLMCANATFTLRFGSGAYTNESAYKPMGFAQADYGPIAPGSSLRSPYRTLLEPLRKIEFFVDEISDTEPVAVVYNTNASYYGQVLNENHARARLLDDSPPRILSQLTMRVRVDGKPVEDAFKNEHSLSFTLQCFTHTDAQRLWLRQFNSI